MTQLELLAQAALHPPKASRLALVTVEIEDLLLRPQEEWSWPDHDVLRSRDLLGLPTDVLSDDRLDSGQKEG